MDTDSAVARLRAMTPAAAGRRLNYLSPDRAAILLAWMEPAFAVHALAGMGWWGPKRILTRMPPEIAADLLAQLRSDTPSGARQDLDFNLWT
jgi:flagellar motility protein MotE (MotC chaperone)